MVNIESYQDDVLVITTLVVTVFSFKKGSGFGSWACESFYSNTIMESDDCGAIGLVNELRNYHSPI